MSEEAKKEPDEKVKRLLVPADIELLFPNRVIQSSEDYVKKAPRGGIYFEDICFPTDLIQHSDCRVWKFSEITFRSNEAAYLDLPPFSIEIDYFGGPEDLRMLFDLIKVVGQTKNEESILAFKLFFDKVLIGVLGADYPSGYDKEADKFKPTEQLTHFKKAILEGQKSVLILFGHGGSCYTNQGSEQKTIGDQHGSKGITLSAYLQQVGLTKYSAIVDLSCTINPRFCLEALPRLLPENCPPFFGSLEPVDAGLGLKACATYLINKREATVFGSNA